MNDKKKSPVNLVSQNQKKDNKDSCTYVPYDKLFDLYPNGVLIEDLKGNILEMNEAFCENLGYRKEELLGQHISMIIPKEDQEKVEQNINKIRNDFGMEHSVKNLKKNGTLCWMALKEKLITLNDGSYGVLVVSSDVTLKKKLDDALRLHSEILRNMAEGVHMVRTSDGIIVYANPTFEKMFGYKDGELIGEHVSVLNAPGEKDAMEIALEIMRYLKEHGTWSGETHNIKKDGSLFWSGATVSSFDHPDHGNVWITVQDDITKQKQMMDALNESEEKFRSMTENMTDLVTITDDTGIISYASPACRDLFGINPDEMIGTHIIKFLDETSIPEAMAAFHTSFAEKRKNLHLELKMKRSDGSTFNGEMKGVLFYWHSQTCSLATISNIDNRKQAEEALKQMNNNLNESNATKDMLLSVLAHDLRSPFNGIIGFSNLLSENLKQKDITSSEKYATLINDSASTTLSLLDSLLVWAKMQIGHYNFKPEKIDLQPLVKEIIDISSPMAMINNITLSNNVAGNIKAFADENMLKTILRNLVSNAIKFTGSGGKIDISATSDRSNVKISVKDNGFGMNEKTRSQIFNKNSLIPNADSESEKSMGLGLILSSEFVKKHGGRIWVETEMGKGSEFLFTLPIPR